MTETLVILLTTELLRRFRHKGNDSAACRAIAVAALNAYLVFGIASWQTHALIISKKIR